MTPLQTAARELIARQTPGWVKVEPTSRSIEALRLALEDEQSQAVESSDFEQWLNFNRGSQVSEVFHEIVARAASSAKAQRVAVTDGWMLVPIKPTPEMIASGRLAPFDFDNPFDVDGDYIAVYKAMLAAAP